MGLPFVLIGQYLIWGRLIVRHWRRLPTTYCLTTLRALVVVRGRGGQERVTAAFLTQVPAINLTRRRDGSGTVMFGNSSGGPSFNALQEAGWPASGRYGPTGPVFADIPDAAGVYRRAMDQRNAASGSGY